MNIFSRVPGLVRYGIVLVFCGFVVWGTRRGRSSMPSRSKQLIVGVMDNYNPYSFADATGKYVGFDVEVAKLLAKKLGREVIIQPLELAALLVSLDQGRVDVLIAGLCMTKKRLEKYEMAHYKGERTTSFPLVFWKQVPTGIATLEDLDEPGIVVLAEPGSSQESYLAEFKSLTIKNVGSMSQIILDLKYGKSNAAFMDPDILPNLMAQTPELVRLDVPLPPDFQTEGIGAVMKKDNVTLAKKLKEAIAEVKVSGELTTLEDKWFVKKDSTCSGD